MPKGRTGYEILKGLWVDKPKPTEQLFFNPLEAKVGSHVRINSLVDFDEQLWKIGEIWAWDRHINGNLHQFSDYVLLSDNQRVVLRVLPKLTKGKPAEPDLLLLTQYWPEEAGAYPWGDESPYVLDGLMDPTGEFVRFKGEPQEERYFRDLSNVSATVHILSDDNGDGVVDAEEVKTQEFSLWTFRRMTTDVANQEFEQYLHVQLSGVYEPKTRTVRGGDKDILILRGESISSSKIMMY